MITGDNALTACHVADEVDIVKREVLIGDTWDLDGSFDWRTIDEKVKISIDPMKSEVPPKLLEYDLCVSGMGLDKIMGKQCFEVLLPRIWVYARVSPNQKVVFLSFRISFF